MGGQPISRSINERDCIVITENPKKCEKTAKKRETELVASREPLLSKSSKLPNLWILSILSPLASSPPFHPPRPLYCFVIIVCYHHHWGLIDCLSLLYYSLLHFFLSLLSFEPFLYSRFVPSTPSTTTISTMPYNTRRKSLSLPSLGIHLPNSSRRSPSISKGSHATDDLPPSKKVKRSHDSLSPEPALKASVVRAGRHGALEYTPPPSPLDGGVTPKIDTEGINDDIVVAVIDQLEKTGNRPLLVKELAAVLVALNPNVARCVLVFLSLRIALSLTSSSAPLIPLPSSPPAWQPI